MASQEAILELVCVTRRLLVFDGELWSIKSIILKVCMASHFIFYVFPLLLVVTTTVIATILKCVWERSELGGVGSLTAPPSGLVDGRGVAVCARGKSQVTR